RAGHQVAVVVSAMAGRTNELVAWTDGAGPAADGLPASDDEYDVVVASGEQVSAGLLAMTLRNIGLHARSWLGWQVPSSPTTPMARRASTRWRRTSWRRLWRRARSRWSPV